MMGLILAIIMILSGSIMAVWVIVMSYTKVLWPDTMISKDISWGFLLAGFTFAVLMFWLSCYIIEACTLMYQYNGSLLRPDT